MKKYIHSLAFLCIFTNLLHAQFAWTPVGPDDSTIFYSFFANSTSIALNKAHLPCIAFDAYHIYKAEVLEYNGTNWTTMGAAGFSAGSINYPSLAFSRSDTTYLAYQDAANAYKATVMKYNGSSWVSVGVPGFTAKGVAYTSLAIDTTGILYLAYLDSSNSNKATVVQYNGTSWVPLGTQGFSVGAPLFMSLSINQADTLYAAYADNGDSNRVTVMKYNGAAWVPVGKAKFSSVNTLYAVSLAFDSKGNPYVAYDDGGKANRLSVMKYSSSKWDSVGNRGFTSATYEARKIALCLDSTDMPIVAYQEYYMFRDIYPEMSRYNGSAWIQQTSINISNTFNGIAGDGSNINMVLDKSSGTAFLSTGSYGYTEAVYKSVNGVWSCISTPGDTKGYALNNSIVISKSGVPYVSLQDGSDSDKISVICFNGSAWVNVGTPGFSAGAVDMTCIGFAPNDTLYVAYKDIKNGGKATVMKYNGSAWVPVGSPGFSSNGISGNGYAYGSHQGLSMVFDKAGSPYIGYTESGGNAMVSEYTGGAWVDIGTGYKFIQQSILASDALGNLYVALLGGNGNRVSMVKYNGSTWNIVGTGPFSPNNSEWYNDWLAFAVAPDGTPYVGFGPYSGYDKFTVMTYNGSQWVYIADTNHSAGTGVTYPFLITDAHGSPYFAYLSYGIGGAGNVEKYDGAGWVSIGGFGENGNIDMAFGPADDSVFVSYSGFNEYVKKTAYPIILGSGVTAASCSSSYTLNGVTYYSSGTYSQKYTSKAGYDSVVTLYLTLNSPTAKTLTKTACSSYTLNDSIYTVSGTYTQNLTNKAGCDSTITLNLTINKPSGSSLTETACSSYSLNSITYTSSGTYIQNLTNKAGCDSTLTLSLTINNTSTGDTTVAACNKFTWYGTLYTSSGLPSRILKNSTGCDSIVTLHLTINSSPAVIVSGKDSIMVAGTDTLIAQGATGYLWNNGATTDTLKVSPTAQTTYTVVGTKNGCTDTTVFVVKIEVFTDVSLLSVSGTVLAYPNPGAQILNLSFSTQSATQAEIEIVDVVGKECISTKTTIENGKVLPIDISSLAQGLYFVSIITDKHIHTIRFIKEQ